MLKINLKGYTGTEIIRKTTQVKNYLPKEEK